MSYLIAGESFTTKDKLLRKCREILHTTVAGQPVTDDAAIFLFAVFQFHDEWLQKAEGGVRYISTQFTSHGTKCFIMRKRNGDEVDISFPHAIRLIPSIRTASLLPQAIRDYRNAARNAVRSQISAFRDSQLTVSITCEVTGARLTRENSAVDHVAPNTFDQLLFDFSRESSINPMNIKVGSQDGTVAVFEDEAILAAWQSFHAKRANLRLLSKLGNLQLAKASVPWSQLFT